jgi:hypothetical protein
MTAPAWPAREADMVAPGAAVRNAEGRARRAADAMRREWPPGAPRSPQFEAARSWFEAECRSVDAERRAAMADDYAGAAWVAYRDAAAAVHK